VVIKSRSNWYSTRKYSAFSGQRSRPAKMRAGSAAKLIVDALLLRFLPLARRRIDTAQAQVGSSYHFHLSIVTTRYFTVRCCIHEDCFTQTKALCRIGF
jgi:hypothetical protein